MLKVTAINKEGNYKDSKSILIDKPKVYTFFLEELFEEITGINQYLIEFFSTNNLFIPFPAVMVNHIGHDFINCVHAYNRVLNDVFEDDQINDIQAPESSIDLLVDGEYDTFFNIASGPFDLKNELKVSLHARDTITRHLSVDLNRLSSHTYKLSEIFDETPSSDSVLKILQPKQNLFYGRIFAGRLNRETGAFSANHSYYDTSSLSDFINGKFSSQSYPYFSNCKNSFTMYPISSPSELRIFVELFDKNYIFKSEGKTLISPSSSPINFEINELVKDSGIENCSLFRVTAQAVSQKMPARVSLQLKYGPLNYKSKLVTSISESLTNEELFNSPQKTRMIWGQVASMENYNSQLGICLRDHNFGTQDIVIQFYGKNGLLKTINSYIEPRRSLIFDSDYLRSLGAENEIMWYVARSEQAELYAQSFHFHRLTGNSSGEHAF